MITDWGKQRRPKVTNTQPISRCSGTNKSETNICGKMVRARREHNMINTCTHSTHETFMASPVCEALQLIYAHIYIYITHIHFKGVFPLRLDWIIPPNKVFLRTCLLTSPCRDLAGFTGWVFNPANSQLINIIPRKWMHENWNKATFLGWNN